MRREQHKRECKECGAEYYYYDPVPEDLAGFKRRDGEIPASIDPDFCSAKCAKKGKSEAEDEEGEDASGF